MTKKRLPATAKGGVWQKLLDALSSKVGKLVSNAELIRVSGQHNYARRVRELRAEGWDVVYNASPGGYVLKSLKKLPKNVDNYINLKLRSKVLQRDNYTCQFCGHAKGEVFEDGEKVRLEVDHISPLKDGGKTVEENLWTLCSRCNAGKKSLFAYPETIKNKIVSLNLPDDLRTQLNQLAVEHRKTVNEILLEVISRGLKKTKKR